MGEPDRKVLIQPKACFTLSLKKFQAKAGFIPFRKTGMDYSGFPYQVDLAGIFPSGFYGKYVRNKTVPHGTYKIILSGSYLFTQHGNVKRIEYQWKDPEHF